MILPDGYSDVPAGKIAAVGASVDVPLYASFLGGPSLFVSNWT